MKNISKIALALILCAGGGSYLSAAQGAAATLQIDPSVEKNVYAAQKVVDAWLALIDQGKYAASYDNASLKMQVSIPRDEWAKSVESWRRPLGTIVSRNIADIRVAENPPGMPAGQYLVFVYQSNFRNKSNVTELVTLLQTDSGEWRVLTYHLK